MGLVLGRAVSSCFADDIQVSPYNINVDRPAAELKFHADTDYDADLKVSLSICLITYDVNGNVESCGNSMCTVDPYANTPDVNTELVAHFLFADVLTCFESSEGSYIYGDIQFTLEWNLIGYTLASGSGTDTFTVLSIANLNVR